MVQPSLYDDITIEEKPWKVVRRVSRQVYAYLRDSGVASRRTWQVVTALAYYRNRWQVWPTAAELAHFMHERKRIERDDPRLVAPRITELVRGRVVKLKDGSKVRKGGGVITLMPLRRCSVTKSSAHPVALREAGSAERQVA
jgi:hypothetical protein